MVALASSETILQKMQESVIFDLILERWDMRWIAKGLIIVKLQGTLCLTCGTKLEPSFLCGNIHSQFYGFNLC